MPEDYLETTAIHFLDFGEEQNGKREAPDDDALKTEAVKDHSSLKNGVFVRATSLLISGHPSPAIPNVWLFIKLQGTLGNYA